MEVVMDQLFGFICCLLFMVGVLCVCYVDAVRDRVAWFIIKHYWFFALILVGAIGFMIWMIIHYNLF